MVLTIPFSMSGNIYTRILWLLSAVHTISCRRYDVNEEAKKLYGEDLNSVLERFRRTPEYLKILSDQMEELSKTIDAVRSRTMYVYDLQLANRVSAEFTNATDINLRVNEDPRLAKFFDRGAKIPRTGSKKLQINMDKYRKFRDPLTLNEKNRMKELGFEYVGRAIHALIEFLTPDNTLSVSTRLPYGGEQADKTTTQYQHNHHEITKSSTNIEPETETTFPTYHHSTTTTGHHRNFGMPNNLI